MAKQTYPMTKEGFMALKEELKELETTARENAKERIQRARSFCDFREDSEYAASVKEREWVEERIVNLKEMIHYAKIIEEKHSPVVEIGSTVSFQELPNGDLETYQIVGIEEAEPIEGKIAYNSPIAESLLGSKEGDEVSIAIPGGALSVKVTKVV